MAIEQVKCRAEVSVGGIVVVTPYVQSFNVRKQRGQISTFDASLKVPAGTASQLAGGDVVIKAGQNEADTTIFTGICRTAKVSPCFDDPAYVMLSISGADKLSLLQGKKFTRRCRATKAAWCSITSIVRKGLKSGKFAYQTEANFKVTEGIQEHDDPSISTRSLSARDGMDVNSPKTGKPPENVIPKIEIINEEQGGTGG